MAEQLQNIEKIEEPEIQNEDIQEHEGIEQHDVIEQEDIIEHEDNIEHAAEDIIEQVIAQPSTSRECDNDDDFGEELLWAMRLGIDENKEDPALETIRLAQINLEKCIQIISDVRRSYDQSIEMVHYEHGTTESDGENYTGTITKARVIFNINGEEIEEKYIIKEDRTTGPKDGEGFFKNEIKMYTWIIPKMWRLICDSRIGEDENLWCDYIGNRPYHSLILADLGTDGFKLANRRLGLDYDHGMLVIKHLAKFHALSKSLMEQGVIFKEDFGPHYTCVAKAPTVILMFYEGGLRQLIRAMRHWPSNRRWLSTRVALQVATVLKRLRDIHESPYDETFQVLNHGDLWTCNMMFTYEDSETPKKLRFLDFQVCHVHSFAWDLTHFLYSSIKHTNRAPIYDKLIKEYHRSLVYYMDKFNCISRRPTLSNVYSEMDRLAYYAFVVVSINYPLASTEQKKAFSLSKLLHSSVNDPTQLPFYKGIFTTKDVIHNLGLDLIELSRKGVI